MSQYNQPIDQSIQITQLQQQQFHQQQQQQQQHFHQQQQYSMEQYYYDEILKQIYLYDGKIKVFFLVNQQGRYVEVFLSSDQVKALKPYRYDPTPPQTSSF